MKRLLTNHSGGTLILTALFLPLLVIVMAVVVDIGRVYAVQAKAQNAMDAALLGAVATISTTSIDSEVPRIFNTNYPTQYMGSTVGSIGLTNFGNGVYEAAVTITVPYSVIGLFSSDFATVHILSQVTNSFGLTPAQRLELALVLDNTGSMSGAKIEALRRASQDLVGILFGPNETLNNIRINLVPYDVAVNLGPDRASWIQGAFLAPYNAMAATGNGFVSNRNTDSPRNSYNDLTNTPPQTEETRFRVPVNASNTSCPDRANTNLPRMRFGMNVKSQALSAVNAMQASGCTRINVGMMWGWFSLSPSWQGLWDPALPGLPASPNPLLDKVVVLMTDGQNTVFNGASSTSVDDDTTLAMCAAVKASNITVYTVGFGSAGDVNPTLLRNCASSPSHFWLAPTEADLRTAFRQIADDIVFSTIRLSK